VGWTATYPTRIANENINVQYGSTGGALGLAYAYLTKPQEVDIRYGLCMWQERRVVAHELLHCAGYPVHSNDPTGFFYFTQGSEPGDKPSPGEIVAIKHVTVVYHVTVKDRALDGATEWATDMWNRNAGHVVFVFSR